MIDPRLPAWRPSRVRACATPALLVTVIMAGGAGLAHAGDRELPRFALAAGNHVLPLTAIAGSPDGKLVATVAPDRTVRVWSAESGKLLETHWLPDSIDAPPVIGLRSGKGGALVLDTGGKRRVLDRSSGKLSDDATPPVGRGDVDAAGRTVLLERRDGIAGRPPERVRLVDAGGKTLATFEPPAAGLVPYSARFSPDGSLVAVGWRDLARIDVLDGATLKPRYQPDLGTVTRGDLRAVVFSGDGSELLAGGTFTAPAPDGEPRRRFAVCRWSNAGSGPLSRVVAVSDAEITDLAVLPLGVVAVATAEPGWALLGREGEPRIGKRPAPQAVRFSGMRVDGSGDRVLLPRSVVEPSGVKPLAVFSVTRRALTSLAPPTMDPSLQPARTTAPDLAVLDWRDSRRVIVNGMAVPLDYTSRSLAIAPDASWFVLGLDGMLHARMPQPGRFVENAWTAVPGSAWSVVFAAEGKLLVTALGDGTIRWFRASDMAELLALYVPEDPERWVLFTPQGYYDAAPGAEALVGWAVARGEGETASYYSLGHFRERFHRPDVIDRVLPSLDVWKAVAAADDAAEQARQAAMLGLPEPSHAAAPTGPLSRQLPPLVTILAPSDGTVISPAGGPITVRAAVRSASGAQVSRVTVLLDGRPAASSRGVVSLGAPAPDAPAADVREVAVTIPAGTADVALAVFGESSTGRGDPAVVRLRRSAPDGQAPARGPASDAMKPKLYLLAIGVGAYPERDLKLRYPAKDASDLAAALSAQKGRLYRAVEARLLTDRAATRAAVLDGLQWLQRQTTERDVAVLFLAGHGIDDPGGGQYFFLPVDADLGRPLASMVGDVQIREALAALAGKVVLLLDTCHAGGVVKGRSLRGTGGGWTRFVNELSSADNGVVVLAASTARQASQEAPVWKNGAFTHALVEGLRGAADYGKTGRITIDMLALYASERVKKLTGGTQTPSSAKPNTLPDFPIAITK